MQFSFLHAKIQIHAFDSWGVAVNSPGVRTAHMSLGGWSYKRVLRTRGGGGGVLLYISDIGVCRPKG